MGLSVTAKYLIHKLKLKYCCTLAAIFIITLTPYDRRGFDTLEFEMKTLQTQICSFESHLQPLK